VAGCAHLFGGEQAVIDDLDYRLTQLCLHHRLSLAEATGAALGRSPPIVPEGRSNDRGSSPNALRHTGREPPAYVRHRHPPASLRPQGTSDSSKRCYGYQRPNASHLRKQGRRLPIALTRPLVAAGVCPHWRA
jgi:hypothetical protein